MKEIVRKCILLFIACVYCHTKVNVHRGSRKIHEMGKKRNLISAKSWERGLLAFRETVIRDYLEGDVKSTRVPKESAVAWLLTILEGSTPEQASTWDTLLREKNMLVGEKADDPTFKKLDETFQKIMQLMTKAKTQSFTRSDQEMIRGTWQQFFPQSYVTTTYSVGWLNALCKYLTILAAGYIDLMKAGVYDDCKLAEQLNMFKPHIVELAKKLARTRYQQLGKVNWNGGQNEYKTTATLTLNDGVTGKVFREIPLTQIVGRILTPLRQQMADFIMKHLVFHYYAMYNSTWGSSSCSLDDPITIPDLEVTYPDECMDADGICALPCGLYSQPTTWCVTKVKTNKWRSPGNGKYYDECRLPDWRTCLYIQQLKPSEFEIENEKPKSENDKPKSENDKPKSENDEPKTENDKPKTENDKPKSEKTAQKENEKSEISSYVQHKDEDNTSSILSDNYKKMKDTSSLILNGVSAITALLEDKIGVKGTLEDSEKKEVNLEIAKKVENYLTEQKDWKNITQTRTLKQYGFHDRGLNNIVGVLVVKALLEKKRYGNLNTYLNGLSRWNIKNDFVKHLRDDDIVLGASERTTPLEKRSEFTKTRAA